MARMKQLIPDLDTINAGVSGNIASMVSGQIPSDVAAQVARSGAAKAFAGGFGGSQRAGGLVARDLGLTSLQLTQQGLDSASRWLSTARSTMNAPQMDVTSMFITPQQQLQNQWRNETARMNLAWTKAQIDAQHDWRTQLGNSIQQTDAMITQTALSMVGGMAGGMLGGAGGMLGGMGGGGGGGGFTTPDNWSTLTPGQQSQYWGYWNDARQNVPPGSVWE